MPVVFLMRRCQCLKLDVDIHQGSIRRIETTASTKEMIDEDDVSAYNYLKRLFSSFASSSMTGLNLISLVGFQICVHVYTHIYLLYIMYTFLYIMYYTYILTQEFWVISAQKLLVSCVKNWNMDINIVRDIIIFHKYFEILCSEVKQAFIKMVAVKSSTWNALFSK